MRLFDNQPAEVQSAESLDALAVQINAAYSQGEQATRRGLEHFRQVGEMLNQAKQRCEHGEWLPWLNLNVKFSRMNAARYMRLAREWDKCNAATHLADAMRILSEEEPAAVPAADVFGEPDPEEEPEADDDEPRESAPRQPREPQPELATNPVLADVRATFDADRETADAILAGLRQAQEALDSLLRRRGGEMLRRVTVGLVPLFEERPAKVDGTAVVRLRWVCKRLAAVAQAVRRTRPEGVCAGCKGAPGGCPGCKGTGFVPHDKHLIRSDAQLVFDFREEWE